MSIYTWGCRKVRPKWVCKSQLLGLSRRSIRSRRHNRRLPGRSNADFPLVFISFPSAKDPDWENRYPGTATVEVLTLAPYEWFRQWEDTKWKRRGEEYEAFKEQLSQRLLAVLYRYEPQLRGKVAHYELSTPLSTRKFANYRHGEIYGVAHTPDRFAQKFLRPHTPVANLYLTGQDIVTAGIGRRTDGWGADDFSYRERRLHDEDPQRGAAQHIGN